MGSEKVAPDLPPGIKDWSGVLNKSWSMYKTDPLKTIPILPEDSAERKAFSIYGGVLRYFPAALREVAKVSAFGANKHSGGRLVWTRQEIRAEEEVAGHLRSLVNHVLEFDAGSGRDYESGLLALTHAAWRALAALQVELEDQGMAPLAPAVEYSDAG